jgi:hypothetical protein
MATTGNPGEPKPAIANQTTGRESTGPATPKTTARRSSAGATRRSPSTRSAASKSTSTQPKTPVEQAQTIAERAVLVPVGASLMARDNLVGTVKGLTTRYRSRAGLEREIKRFERRGATERNRFERQVRRTRTRFERELRHRRSNVERSVRANRRRLEREVRTVRKDLGTQSAIVTARVDQLVSNAQRLISNSAL